MKYPPGAYLRPAVFGRLCGPAHGGVYWRRPRLQTCSRVVTTCMPSHLSRRLVAILLVSAALASPLAPLHGQEPSGSLASLQPDELSRLKGLSLEELANVEVTTTNKQPESVWQAAAAVYVITGEDIRRSGATTIPDALRLAPGVIVSQSDANRWAVGVRGFADLFSKGVLVLIDGRSVYTPLVGGVHWAIQDVILADVQQIEVIRGPGATVWGANAVNGVINIITTPATTTPGARLVAASGNVERGRVSVKYGGAVGDRFDYRVYGKLFTRAPQFHAGGADFDAWRSGQAGVRGEWAFAARDRLTVSADLYRTSTGERADVTFYVPPVTETRDERLRLTGGNALVRWDRQFAGGAEGRLQAYYDRTVRGGFTFAEVRNTVDVDFNIRQAPWRRHTIAWGAGARVSPSTVTQLVPTLNFVPESHRHTLASAFVHDNVALLRDRLSVSFGAKLEHNSYTGVEVLPSAQVLWRPTGEQSVWAAVTRAVRTPSRFERDLRFQVLIGAEPVVYAAIAGSETFTSENVRGLEVGYRTLISPTFYIDVTGFTNQHGRLAGLGEAVPSLETSPVPHVRVTFPFANTGEATSRGFEVAPDWKPLARWQLKGSYSHLRLAAETAAAFTNTTFSDNYEGLAPRHQVRVQSRLDLPSGVELDQTYRYVSALRSAQVRAYHALDLRLGWRPSRRVEIALVGQNLLQPHHAEFNAVPVEIRRNAYVQLVLGQ